MHTFAAAGSATVARLRRVRRLASGDRALLQEDSAPESTRDDGVLIIV